MTEKRGIEDSIVDGEAGGKRQRIVQRPNEDHGRNVGQGKQNHTIEVRRDCPFLDTVNRQVLDFDFEKKCSVSGVDVFIYACLVCGKYYQGKGRNTHAYTHSHKAGHNIYINVETEKVYCLPDGYEVKDSSLDDIPLVLNPRFTLEQVKQLDKNIQWSRALDGSDYLPGTHTRSPLVHRFGELTRKIWHAGNFKGQVNPHLFLQAVMESSEKRFLTDVQSDPAEFMSWLLTTLHDHLRGSENGSNVIHQCFQGELEVVEEIHNKPIAERSGNGDSRIIGTGEDGENEAGNVVSKTRKMPFLVLNLDLPPPPMFRDAMEKNIIPQVPLFNILKKFDGETVTEVVGPGTTRTRYRLTKLPRYLIVHMQRFTRNNFFLEKNPTLVNFPVKNLELKDYILVPAPKANKRLRSKYDLIANTVHDGRPGEGSYRVFVQRKSEDLWYQVQDLHVSETLPQMVALSEAYMQIYEQQ